MSLDRREGPKVLFGPYGTELEELGRLLGIPDLAESPSILKGGLYRQAVVDKAREYARIAHVATTHTFGLRHLLRRDDELQYREALKAHHEVVTGVIGDVKRDSGRVLDLFVSCSTYGDCYYKDKKAPDAALARDFHTRQFAAIKDLPGDKTVLFETICTGPEALGIARAARDLSVPVIISFVVRETGKLLSGESLHDVIGEIEGEPGEHPVGYSINCCPIKGVWNALDDSNGYRNRVIMAYPNASNRDPGELEEIAGVVRVDDHSTRARELTRLAHERGLEIVGGCCGFDPAAVEVLAKSIAANVDSQLVADVA